MRAVIVLTLALFGATVLSAPPPHPGSLTTAVRKRGSSGGGRSSSSSKASSNKSGSSKRKKAAKVAAGAAAAAAAAAAAKKASKKKKKGSFGGSDGEFGDEEEEGFDCFPASALVEDGAGRRIALGAIRVGTTVRTGTHSTSRVFMFSHAEPVGMFDFIELNTAGGKLTASEGHIVHTARGALPAGEVRVGDRLLTADGAQAPVISTIPVRERGLYNPQTLDGNIVIDGFVVSTFTTVVPTAAASSMLAPLRAVFGVFDIDLSCSALEKSGVARTVFTALLSTARRLHAVSPM